MQRFRRGTRSTVLSVLAAGWLAHAAGAQTPVDPCSVGGVSNVAVSLMTAVSDSETRREEMHFSRPLAITLGFNPPSTGGSLPFVAGGEINPQLRVVIEAPSPIASRTSTAIFTVTGVFDATNDRIRIYRSNSTGDVDSGQFKLFAGATQAQFDAARTNAAGDLLFVDPADGLNKPLRARVYWTPVSTSTLTVNQTTGSPASVTTTTQSFCEPALNNPHALVERTTVELDDKRFALLVPHGGAIETSTSDQIATVLDTLRTGHGVRGNLWEVNGTWVSGLNQVRARWHITATALLPQSFLGLSRLMSEPDFGAAQPYRYAVALHGYGDSGVGVIVGGGASRLDKCWVARRILDELQTSRGNRSEIGLRVHDAAGDVLRANAAGYTPPDQHAGVTAENIVNRLAPPPVVGPGGRGGIQLEQSKSLRDDQTNGQGGSGSTVRGAWLRHVVARGTARAVGELLAAPAPLDACTLTP